jgi:hypothetical protein
MDLFTEHITAEKQIKKEFLQKVLIGKFHNLRYRIADINKLFIEIEYVVFLHKYLADDNDEKFEQELLEIIYDVLNKRKENGHLEKLHYDMVVDGLTNWGLGR